MKITHWGQDYAEVKIGTKTFEISLAQAHAIERFLKRLNK